MLTSTGKYPSLWASPRPFLRTWYACRFCLFVSLLESDIILLHPYYSSSLAVQIFCHQEESNWPLGDPATLKKKFDDIFASTRYTKALDVLKKQKKDLAQQLKEAKLRLDTVQLQLNTCRKVRARFLIAPHVMPDSFLFLFLLF